ncbi:helix-turn-helix transcriptional regulator [Lysinibacillus sp. M3]|uniref:Helix-turn-helix transcriptional regulator n=1 Tax=Lysinibacillus zambalensis TaxID=3160866 RepID=A0ABV1MZ03_9BACI
MSNVPQRLKELRKEASLTQADVAKFLNISESAYGYYEQGRNEISIGSIQKLAEKYDVSVAYILCETNEKQPFDKDESAFQAFTNDPSLQKWYKELPKSREEDLQKLRKMWEILKDNGEI